jgi:hypothetical protein
LWDLSGLLTPYIAALRQHSGVLVKVAWLSSQSGLTPGAAVHCATKSSLPWDALLNCVKSKPGINWRKGKSGLNSAVALPALGRQIRLGIFLRGCVSSITNSVLELRLPSKLQPDNKIMKALIR